MKRPLFTILSVLSLLLCIATCALWARSCAGRPMDMYAVTPARSYGVGTEPGRVIGFLQQERATYREGDGADVQIRKGDFRYLRITSDGMRRWNLVVPIWLIAGTMAILPFCWMLRRARLRHRWVRGLCIACGYDLRATRDRCPECGTVVAKT